MNPHDPLPESLPDWVKEGLPPLREDEPQDLRQAIADELGDHLACAFESELGRRDGEDAETEARRAALQRFGDPKAVARRLWLDAMKERIMSQRIIVVSSAVLALTCLAISLFAFMAMRRTATVNEAILARLESLEQASKREVIPAGLSYAKFHFRAGSAKGTPVSGVEVSLRKNDEKSALSIFDSYLKRGKTGADGDLRLGPIAPDTYQYCYDAPDNSHVSFVVFGTCQTFGGYETEETVIFPSVLMADQTARLRLKLNLPEDLSGKDFYFGFYLAADFEESGRTWMCFSQYLLNGKGDIFRCKFDGKDSLDLGGVAPLESSTLALPPVKYKAGIRR
ncbi:hypothetical protein HY256_03180, partial [Candidatus Sumerlaeota bacterium]|nr:hypothetical protein [Candidatus Sumerlaeota bacterium]